MPATGSSPSPRHELALRDYGRSHGSHAHDHFQVLIGLHGVLEIEVEGRGAGIGAGEAQVIAPGERHDFNGRKHGSLCLVLDTTQPAWARARWHEPLGVADLADVACLSPSQFAQRCREEQGTSPMHWLRALRLAHARELRLGGLDVAETARRTGYRSPSALTAALRR